MPPAAEAEPMLSTAACVAGLIVCVFSVILAVCALASTASQRRMLNVSPSVKCFVAGLLCGLGLFVMLPAALDELPYMPGWTTQDMMFVFASAPPIMFFVHHVVLGHSHHHPSGHQHLLPNQQCGSSESCALEHAPGTGSSICTLCDAPAAKRIIFGQPTSKICIVVGTDMRAQPVAPKKSVLRLQWVGEVAVAALRAWPYFLHSMIDGAMVGMAQSWQMLVSLTLCVSLCAVQDVGTILISLSASGASRSVKLASNLLFAVGFPVGASLGVAFAATVALAPLMAFASGLFLYMAIFELAPPHAHGRWAALTQLFAFSAGIGLVVVSEAIEDWAMVGFSVESAAPVSATQNNTGNGSATLPYR